MLMTELSEATLDAAAVGVAGVVNVGTALALSCMLVVARAVARPDVVLVGVWKEDCVAFGEWVSCVVAFGVADK
jgi:hypothetical protein